jgi:formate--tetrahydrofolate ligase
VAPSAVVLVATVRALKMHGGVAKDRLKEPNVEALASGTANLRRHIRNVEKFGITPVVAVNKFASDTQEELDWLLEWCAGEGVQAAVADVWGRGGGGDGGDELAAKVLAALDAPHSFRHLYPLQLSVEDKIRTIVQEMYGADGVDFSVPALKRLAEIEKNGWAGLPVCMAKTQYSFSDDATRLGAPKGFTVHVRDLIPKTGAGFIVALTGAVMTMPGLPKVPAAMRMDVDDTGKPVGLF